MPGFVGWCDKRISRWRDGAGMRMLGGGSWVLKKLGNLQLYDRKCDIWSYVVIRNGPFQSLLPCLWLLIMFLPYAVTKR